MTNVTTISARGYVTADYDTASFAMTFSETAPKAKAAKAALKKGVEQVTSTIEALKKSGLVMLASSYRTSVTVAPNWVYNDKTRKNVLEGQKATYTLSFQTQTLEMVNDVYDALSELDLNELNLASPTHSVRAEAELKQQALEDAWRVAQTLFANQCAVLNLNPTNFFPSSWNVDYSGQSYGKFRNSTNAVAMSASGGFSADEDDAIEINAGRAKVEVTLSVVYSRVSL